MPFLLHCLNLPNIKKDSAPDGDLIHPDLDYQMSLLIKGPKCSPTLFCQN
jgi:hypothetical protein